MNSLFKNIRKKKIIATLILFVIMFIPFLVMISLDFRDTSESNKLLTGNQNFSDNNPISVSQGNGGDVWWNYSWRYRIPINISSGVDLTDYQVQIDINLTEWYEKGYLDESGKDIRFANSSGVELDFWIEDMEVSGEKSTIWVKIPKISQSEIETIYMYFGNLDAEMASSIDNTMDSGLRYFYYRDINRDYFHTFHGTDVYSTAPNFNWGGNYIILNGNPWENLSDYVSIRWEGWIANDGDGGHIFWIYTDDGSKLWINNTVIMDKWYDQSPHEHYSTPYIFSSIIPIKYEWYEWGGQAVSQLGWTPPGGSKTYPIPGSHLWCRKYSETEPTVSIGEAEPGLASIKVNAFDLYGYPIPNANVSIYNYTAGESYLISGLTNDTGSILFEDLGFMPLNLTFNVSITSDSGLTRIINTTSDPIIIETIPIDETYTEINLICDASTHILNVKDVDGVPVDTAWVEVGNSTSPFIQNCSINSIGNATFIWINDTTNYNYNYTVYYEDSDYEYPSSKIVLATGNFTDPTDRYDNVIVNMTTIVFMVHELNDIEATVSNVKLEFKENGTGNPIVDLVTNTSGQATLRWFISSELSTYDVGANGNYTLRAYFGGIKQFGVNTPISATYWSYTFNFATQENFNISLNVDPTFFQTELIDLNPTIYPSIKQGAQFKIRVLFNITKYDNDINHPYVGPNTTDSIKYTVIGVGRVFSGNLYPEEEMGIGYYYGIIDTRLRDMDIGTYTITITASKTQFQSPSPKYFYLTVQKNDLLVNQSENDNSMQTTYWNEDVNMSIKPYGQYEEFLTIEDNIFNNNNEFQFSIPDASNVWNLTELELNIDNINWTADSLFANIIIEDPWGNNHTFTQINSSLNVPIGDNLGYCHDIIIPKEYLNKKSPTTNNIFNFKLYGTFNNAVDVTAQAKLVRDQIDVQYTQFNITDSISIPYSGEGWAIKNITFNIYNCKDKTDWSDINPEDVNLVIRANQNFTATNRFTYSVANNGVGKGLLSIDNITLFPYSNQFSFSVEADNPNVIFDVNMSVKYIQYFYEYYNLENITQTDTILDISYSQSFQIIADDLGWQDMQTPILYFDNINNGTQYFQASEVNMKITIAGQEFSVADSVGGGYFLMDQLLAFSKNTIYSVSIETSQPVNYTVRFEADYSRSVFKDLKNDVSSVTYLVGPLSGSVSYNSNQEYYTQRINTTALEVRTYTVTFTVAKKYYLDGTRGLDLQILSRPTSVNDSIDASFTLQVYVWQAKNFTLEYKDTRVATRVSDCEILYYNWWKLDADGNRLTSEGNYGLAVNNITETVDSLYVLNFDTANKPVGKYEIAAHIRKENYEEQTVYFSLTILERPISIIPLKFQVDVDYGENIQFSIQLSDGFSNLPLNDASVILTLDGALYPFIEIGDGLYQVSIPTSDMDAFFADKTLSCKLSITKDNYVSINQDFNIVVNMQEIFEGVPLFYFILGVAITATVIAAVAIYRYVQLAKIPEFVKKARNIKKQIKAKEAISEEYLYPIKEQFIAEQYGDEWKELGLSIDDSLGLEKKGGKKLSNKSFKEGGAQ